MEKPEGKRRRFIGRLVVATVSILIAVESCVQLSGIVDVPIYLADREIGYIPAPGQSGIFLHMHAWRFNELSMGAGPFRPTSGRFNLLLVGDSVVLGGNPFAESERLGPQLEKLTGWQVWPIAAGSWALQNELIYLRIHPQVLAKVDGIAILLNSGDFGAPSSWTSQLTHPRHHPFPGALYIFNKYVVHPSPMGKPELEVPIRDWRADLRNLSATLSVPLFIFMYPNRVEIKDPEQIQNRLYAWAPDLLDAAGGKARVYRVADDKAWKDECYGDGIHPNAAGNAVLAGIIHRELCQSGLLNSDCR